MKYLVFSFLIKAHMLQSRDVIQSWADWAEAEPEVSKITSSNLQSDGVGQCDDGGERGQGEQCGAREERQLYGG